MRKNVKLFLKSLYLSSVIVFCLIFGILGITKAYKSIRLIAYGEYRDVIEVNENEIKIFDYQIKR